MIAADSARVEYNTWEKTQQLLERQETTPCTSSADIERQLQVGPSCFSNLKTFQLFRVKLTEQTAELLPCEAWYC